MWVVSSAVEHYLDMVGVTGSIPVPPTIFPIKFNILGNFCKCGIAKIDVLWRRRGGLLHHSDPRLREEGSQYLAIKYTERLAGAGIEPSVGSVGDSYDNALAETINGLYKAEVIHRRGPWRSFEAVEFATLEWVDWFNNWRLLEPIGNIPPAEAEQNDYAAMGNIPMAA